MSYSGPAVRPPSLMLSMLSPECAAVRQFIASAGTTSTTYPTANLAIYIPIVLSAPFKAVKAFVANGASTDGNWDVGVYNESWGKIASTGQQGQSGTTTIQSFDITDFTLPPGRYYLAFSATSNTATYQAYTAVAAHRLSMYGFAEETSAGTLPATATPAVCTTTVVPIFGFSRRSLV